MNRKRPSRSWAGFLLAGCGPLVAVGALPGCTRRPRGAVYIKHKRKAGNNPGQQPTPAR